MKKITAIEAMKLRHYYDTGAMSLCKDLADIHGCIPAKGGAADFYEFLNTVFNAGRIDGVRQERDRRRASHE